jgi:hypothetical protein
MGRPVWWVEKNIPADEFDRWIAYYGLYPFGPKQEDYRCGVVAEQLSLLTKAHGARKAHKMDHWFTSQQRRGVKGDGGKSFRVWALANCPAAKGAMERRSMEKTLTPKSID